MSYYGRDNDWRQKRSVFRSGEIIEGNHADLLKDACGQMYCPITKDSCDTRCMMLVKSFRRAPDREFIEPLWAVSIKCKFGGPTSSFTEKPSHHEECEAANKKEQLRRATRATKKKGGK